MSPSQRQAFARSYRLMAGKLFVHLHVDGKADEAGARDKIAAAHDALLMAIREIERD